MACIKSLRIRIAALAALAVLTLMIAGWLVPASAAAALVVVTPTGVNQFPLALNIPPLFIQGLIAEPASLLLFGAGLIAVGLRLRRQRQR